MTTNSTKTSLTETTTTNLIALADTTAGRLELKSVVTANGVIIERWLDDYLVGQTVLLEACHNAIIDIWAPKV